MAMPPWFGVSPNTKLKNYGVILLLWLDGGMKHPIPHIVTVATPSATTNILNAPDVSPSDDWTLDQIAAYARAGFDFSAQAETQAKWILRTSVVAYFRAGHALSIAKARLKESGAWVKWQDEHRLSRSTVLTAISIYEGAKDESTAAMFTLSEAKKKWQRNRPRTQMPLKPQPVKPTNQLSVLSILDAAISQLMTVAKMDVSSEDSDAVEQKLGELRYLLAGIADHVRKENTPVNAAA